MAKYCTTKLLLDIICIYMHTQMDKALVSICHKT